MTARNKKTTTTLDLPNDFRFYIDAPVTSAVYDRKIEVRGWMFSAQKPIASARLLNGDDYTEVQYGQDRGDVARQFNQFSPEIAGRSGFSADLEYKGVNPTLEVNFGDGYVPVHEFSLENKLGQFIEKIYNPDLADVWAEHEDTMRVRKGYYWEAPSQPYTLSKDAPKLVAFYLPQFHPAEVNDRVWGKGFTEWTNVTSARPRFAGHNQPLLPADLGYYDLRLAENIKAQIDLAKQNGIYGFCVYYYWFSGKKVLNSPLETIVDHKEWDFNFCICWANENWTKRWDGQDNEVILAQEYKDSDPIDFIKDVEHVLLDSRYIRVDGKPVLVLYRPEHTQNPKDYVSTWRSYFREKHNLELHVVSVLGFSNRDPRDFGMDAAIQFVPPGMGYAYSQVYGTPTPHLNVADKLIDKNFSGVVNDYRKIVLDNAFIEHGYDFPTYRCVMPGWDNDARKKGSGTCFYRSNPDLYQHWLDKAIDYQTSDTPLTFINAWNEWAEGTVLEPTQVYGHAQLNRTLRVVAEKSGVELVKTPKFGFRAEKRARVAAVVHLYHTDRWPRIARKLSLLGDNVDPYIILQAHDLQFAAQVCKDVKRAQTIVLPNRGRDILPFLQVVSDLRNLQYDAILKIHSKKSMHREDGDDWFDDLLDKLVPNKLTARQYLKTVSDEQAIIGPSGHIVPLGEYMGGNKPRIVELLGMTHGQTPVDELIGGEDTFFVAGSMFYASMSCLAPLLDLYLSLEDFEPEKGQIDGTTAHAVERLLTLSSTVTAAGHSMYRTGRLGPKKITAQDIVHDYKFTG